MESGTVQVTEWSNYTLAVRFKAAAMGLSFLPARSLLGTDTFRCSAARKIVCPFTGEVMLAIPALYPDVAAIHVHEADRFGNCRIRGTTVADLELARAARRLIITCERLIPDDEIRSDPTRTVIPFWCVDAVCEVPFGSYPGNMPYEYYSDEAHLKQWLDAEREPERYQKFLDDYLFTVTDFNEYLLRCGGLPRLQELRRQEFLL
jgi:glutaconate CoA-transferase subunit A